MPYICPESDLIGTYNSSETDTLLAAKAGSTATTTALAGKQDINGAGQAVLKVLNAEPADGALAAGQAILYLDETGSKLMVKAKFADGTTIKKGSVTLA